MATLSDLLRSGYIPPTESPMTDVVAEHLRSIPRKFEENQAQQMSLLNQAFPGNTYESMMTQGDPKAMAELAMQTPFNAMIAYHGTPHNILGKFDISKVGTGEGAQAYGHGMYFAEAPQVAEGYKNAITQKNNEAIKYAGKTTKEIDDALKELSYFYKNAEKVDLSNKQELAKFVKNAAQLSEQEGATDIAKTLKSLDVNKLQENTGNLYKVDIPDEYIPKMLDWDKPIGQQSKVVQDALKQIGITGEMTGKELYKFMPEQMQAETLNFSKKPSDADVSKYLNSLGIKGIRYLDEGSRSAGKGTSNFVVFDPSEVKILEKTVNQLAVKS